MSKLDSNQKKALLSTLFAAIFIILALGLGFGLGINFIVNNYTIQEISASSGQVEDNGPLDHLNGEITELTSDKISLKNSAYKNDIVFSLTSETELFLHDFQPQEDPEKSRITTAQLTDFQVGDEVIVFSKDPFNPNENQDIIILNISKIIK